MKKFLVTLYTKKCDLSVNGRIASVTEINLSVTVTKKWLGLIESIKNKKEKIRHSLLLQFEINNTYRKNLSIKVWDDKILNMLLICCHRDIQQFVHRLFTEFLWRTLSAFPVTATFISSNYFCSVEGSWFGELNKIIVKMTKITKVVNKIKSVFRTNHFFCVFFCVLNINKSIYFNFFSKEGSIWRACI